MRGPVLQVNYGLSLACVRLVRVDATSADGRTLAGAALNAEGQSVAWKVTGFGDPVVAVRGPAKWKTRQEERLVRGTARDDESIARVQYRVGPRRKFRPAKGQLSWKARVPLQPGQNRIFFRATDPEGNLSPLASIRIQRRP